MPEQSATDQPGVVPAVRRTAGTMFAALRGELTAHAWGDPGFEHEAYLLFHQRSLAMGFDDRSAGGGSEDRLRRAPGLWFAARDPRSRTPVEVDINSGRYTSVPDVAERLADCLRHLEQPVFAYSSHDLVGRDAVLAPPFDDSFWNGPPLHGMALRGELTEWSCDAIGWLAEALADTSASLGVRTPLLFTVTRTRSAG
ncbi:hypothetical protein [Streptomyces sp. C36]|uniref:hypothetical protein n=1 Tax=Streptomyces sp. C36 TaxID=3237122 RepID=UPI0034C61A34